MSVSQVQDHARAVRTCDEVLVALAAYAQRDEAIEALEAAIRAERLGALGQPRVRLDR